MNLSLFFTDESPNEISCRFALISCSLFKEIVFTKKMAPFKDLGTADWLHSHDRCQTKLDAKANYEFFKDTV